jgi:NAD(P)-dependent dehydrogenase (short-subunit alcohol dehydrogenase family)
MPAFGKAVDGDAEQRSAVPAGQFDLTGRRAVVTGAARGIGRAAAVALARHGAELVLVDVLEEELADSAQEIARGGRAARSLRLDVRSDDDVRRLAETTASLGGLDVLVNAAGIIHRAHATEAKVEDLDRMWEVNVRGLYAVTQAVLPQLVERGSGGKIVNVGSLGSVLGLERRAAYAATKGAVRQYTQSMAVDLGPYGICVNAIAPGYVETCMTADWLNDDGDRRRRLLERIPSGRFGQPADMEGAFVFLAAPASDYVTGQIVVVDGGWSSC